MHRGHPDHDHGHDHGPFGHHDHHHHEPAQPHAHAGHNAPRAAQWQTPHLPPGHGTAPAEPRQQDLDLVEAAFVEGFTRASDATSFLRLAGIPFVGVDGAGRTLHLLRCEIEDVTDVGSVAPLLGGAGLRYDPLPEKFVSRRRRLAFAYHDGRAVVRLDFAAARGLADRSAASRIDFAEA
jgi:hypothetical protein